MKNAIICMTFMLLGTLNMAQSKYEKVMASTIEKVEKSQSLDELQELKDTFHRISEKEKTWHSYYYAGFAAVQKGRLLIRKRQKDELDMYGDMAIEYANKAKELSPNNAEVLLLLKMGNALKMMVDPQSRYMDFGMKAVNYLAEAEKLSPNNPRITLIKAEDTYFTPKAFGGSKEKGITLFKKALELFETFKPAHKLDPNWGKEEAQYFVKKAQ